MTSGVEKFGFYLGIVAVLVLLGMIFFSTNGIMDFRALKEKEAMVNARARMEERENQKMEKEIKSLQHDIDYIKHLAKHEHDMAESDELIFKQKTTEKDPRP